MEQPDDPIVARQQVVLSDDETMSFNDYSDVSEQRMRPKQENEWQQFVDEQYRRSSAMQASSMSWENDRDVKRLKHNLPGFGDELAIPGEEGSKQ
ncbi:MAG: hypothetical protein NXI04_21340 [Planctomycetaceae bacterium]|nr:hypothetical protein [Planctomycetaceae bacterium]